MGERHMRILVTGFEPFGGQETNASWEAVRQCPYVLGSVELIKELLPVVYDSVGKCLEQLIRTYRPDAVLCVGQAKGRCSIMPEKIAINWKDSKAEDNAGVAYHGEPIEPDGADGYFATIPVEKICDTLKGRGIPAQVSYSAGTYVCNCTMYSLLYFLKKTGLDIPAGFIHVPCTYGDGVLRPDIPAMPLSVIVSGLEAVIMCVAEELMGDFRPLKI